MTARRFTIHAPSWIEVEWRTQGRTVGRQCERAGPLRAGGGGSKLRSALGRRAALGLERVLVGLGGLLELLLARREDVLAARARLDDVEAVVDLGRDRKSTRLNSSHVKISYAVF